MPTDEPPAPLAPPTRTTSSSSSLAPPTTSSSSSLAPPTPTTSSSSSLACLPSVSSSSSSLAGRPTASSSSSSLRGCPTAPPASSSPADLPTASPASPASSPPRLPAGLTHGQPSGAGMQSSRQSRMWPFHGRPPRQLRRRSTRRRHLALPHWLRGHLAWRPTSFSSLRTPVTVDFFLFCFSRTSGIRYRKGGYCQACH
ncbi:uncharacterized protein LOC133645603 [Entelurus aequoreus]|uniref:uncharacterized protein LOC133645603 n=1 Tax=Entelurus aequoreus TaxID=161455 RepID=UPI002B1DD47B|nr:uncharacterized protein LOC133645603 [Entelurus aequoreus]